MAGGANGTRRILQRQKRVVTRLVNLLKIGIGHCTAVDTRHRRHGSHQVRIGSSGNGAEHGRSKQHRLLAFGQFNREAGRICQQLPGKRMSACSATDADGFHRRAVAGLCFDDLAKPVTEAEKPRHIERDEGIHARLHAITGNDGASMGIGEGRAIAKEFRHHMKIFGKLACMNIVSLGGFAAARSLSTGFNETPTKASRPFDTARDGFVMGEGAGVLVIEALSHALARGATPIAELVGYGTTADAHHITSGPEDGSGARRAMEIAIAQAGIAPHEIGHLNAHATSTPVGDLGEIRAIKSVFGQRKSVAVSGTKSATGHLLGAAGGLEAIFTILALKNRIAPPTLNLNAPDTESDGIDFVANLARSLDAEYAISNGFGFGGVNASVLFRRWPKASNSGISSVR